MPLDGAVLSQESRTRSESGSLLAALHLRCSLMALNRTRVYLLAFLLLALWFKLPLLWKLGFLNLASYVVGELPVSIQLRDKLLWLCVVLMILAIILEIPPTVL